MPAKKILKLWRGNTAEFVFRLKQDHNTPLDLTGSTFVMSIIHGGPRIELSSSDGGITIATPTTGELTVPISVALSRSILQRTGGVQYEIERRIDGAQTTILFGTIEFAGGNNAD